MSALYHTRPQPRQSDVSPPKELLKDLSHLTDCFAGEDRLDTINLFNRLWDIIHNDHPWTTYDNAHLTREYHRLTEENPLGFWEFTKLWIEHPGLTQREQQRAETERERNEREWGRRRARNSPGLRRRVPRRERDSTEVDGELVGSWRTSSHRGRGSPSGTYEGPRLRGGEIRWTGVALADDSDCEW